MLKSSSKLHKTGNSEAKNNFIRINVDLKHFFNFIVQSFSVNRNKKLDIFNNNNFFKIFLFTRSLKKTVI